MDVILGSAKFVNENAIEVNGQQIEFLKCVIATGGKPNVPLSEITGLDQVPYHTSDTIWNLVR